MGDTVLPDPLNTPSICEGHYYPQDNHLSLPSYSGDGIGCTSKKLKGPFQRTRIKGSLLFHRVQKTEEVAVRSESPGRQRPFPVTTLIPVLGHRMSTRVSVSTSFQDRCGDRPTDKDPLNELTCRVLSTYGNS